MMCQSVNPDIIEEHINSRHRTSKTINSIVGMTLKKVYFEFNIYYHRDVIVCN